MRNRDNSSLIAETAPFIKELCGREAAATIMESAQANYKNLVSENADEPKALYPHTRKRIYPGIAVFQALTAAGVSRENAADLLLRFYRQRSQKPAASIRKLLRVPGLYRFIPHIFKAVVKKSFGEDAGFRAVYHDTPKGALHFDMTVCPYYEICKRYDCSEIVAAYCETDDVCYGNMHPRIIWRRTKTLGRGGDCCDFRITVK